MPTRLLIILASSLWVAAGCDLLGLEGCSQVGYAALTVVAVDSASGGPLPESAQMTVKATEGAFTDSVTIPARRDASLAFERTGTYTVHVSVPGYYPWTVEGVTVRRKGNCTVIQTAHLIARLRNVD